MISAMTHIRVFCKMLYNFHLRIEQIFRVFSSIAERFLVEGANVYVCDIDDVHTLEDVKRIEEKTSD